MRGVASVGARIGTRMRFNGVTRGTHEERRERELQEKILTCKAQASSSVLLKSRDQVKRTAPR